LEININPDIIIKLLELLEKLLKKLESTSKIPKDIFLNDFTEILAVQRALVLSINICIDIGAHILTANNINKPETYKEIFADLSKNNVISKHLSESLTEFVGLRNLLGNIYSEINNNRIYEIIQNELDLFRNFQKQLLKKFRNQLKN
jgi:uncharacterized protein YutE (UPF0331/DUF86 family)